jgi:ribosomal protein S11
MAKKTGSSRKRTVKVEPIGQAHIHASFNNIIISLTNNQGQVISPLTPPRWLPRTAPRRHMTSV